MFIWKAFKGYKNLTAHWILMYDLDQSFYNDEGWKKKELKYQKTKIPSISCFLINQTCLKAERENYIIFKIEYKYFISIWTWFNPIYIFFVPSWIFKDWKFSCQLKRMYIENCYPIFSWFIKKNWIKKER